MSAYDAVVVGAGHNGLTCAAYLARAGLRVVVVEVTDRIGGACVTEELVPGVKLSTAAYAVSLMLPQVIEELDLDLQIRQADPAVFAPLQSGGGVLLWNDERRRADEISKVSRADAVAYPQFLELFGEAVARFRPFLTYPATRKQIRRAFRQSDVKNLFARTVSASIAELAEDYFESELMQGLTASQGIIGSAAGPRTPGTAYVYLHHALGLATGQAGVWGSVRGGMGTITAQLADRVRAAGGEIRLESEVAKLKLNGRRTEGVVLASGEEIDAPIVCSNAHPQTTARFVGGEALPPEFIQDVDLMPTAGTVVKVNCVLGGLPKFSGMSDGIGPEHLGIVTIAPSIEYLEEGSQAAAQGRPAERMFCEAWIQSAGEDGLAPEGLHTLSVFAQYAPYELSEGSWEERRDEVGDLVLETLEAYAPGLTDLVEARMVLGPPDLERRFGLVGGNIFHGELLPEWLFERRPAYPWHRHRLPIPGFYLCGSGSHPGGGVSGAPGRNAARAVLEDLVARGDGWPSAE